MISPPRWRASSTPRAVLPVAVGPTTASTGRLSFDSAKLHFRLPSGQREAAGAAVGTERRHLAREDLFGQGHQLLGRDVVSRLDRRPAGDALEDPLGLFA